MVSFYLDLKAARRVCGIVLNDDLVIEVDAHLNEVADERLRGPLGWPVWLVREAETLADQLLGTFWGVLGDADLDRPARGVWATFD